MRKFAFAAIVEDVKTTAKSLEASTLRVFESPLNFSEKEVERDELSEREKLCGSIGILRNFGRPLFVPSLDEEEKANGSRQTTHDPTKGVHERIFSESFQLKICLDFSSLDTIGSYTPAFPSLEII